MKFGIFYEHQIPRPWDDRSEQRTINESLDQIELADSLGYDHAWVVEHHFLEEYSHASAPEVFLGAASQRTKNIRLGHGIVQITTNQPHRVAEKVSTLDLLTGGRVELGLGEGAGPAELHPARNVVPKPLQKPHPPLWVACSNIQTIGKAGEWGMGALGFSFVNADAAQAWVHRYYNNLLHRQQKLTDYPINPNVAVANGFFCAETDEEAVEKASGWTFFIFALSYYGRMGVDAPGKSDLWAAYQDWRNTDKAKDALANALVGSPATLRKKLRMFADAHVDQIILVAQAGRTSHEDICKSYELFAREVMPEFHAEREAQEAWKQDVLAGRIVLEELTTDGYDIYSHQNEDIVRLTPEQLKAQMAEKEAAKKAAAGDD